MDITVMKIVLLWILLCLSAFGIGDCLSGRQDYLTYTREHLFSLRGIGVVPPTLPVDCMEIRRPAEWPERRKKAKKKRGSRGGVRHRLWRRGNRFPLPVITLTNVRSVSNKLDELALRAEHDCEFRQSNLVCLTESWLKDYHDTPTLPGYTTIRADRNERSSRKSIGGGLCLFVDNRWATQYCVREQVCTPDYELLTVTFRPFYLPREFGQITIILVYVPGPNDAAAGEKITESYNDALARSADQPVLVLGDFNLCNLSTHLPTVHQYVDCTTRLNRTLDRCYGNIPEAYKAVCRPPLGKSDHNVIHLLPKYKAMLKRTKPVIKQIQTWSGTNKDQLRDCFDNTNWDTFFESCQDGNELTDTLTTYIKFCEDCVSETKTIRIFPNNKPWVSKQLKTCLNERKIAFCSGNMELVQEKRKQLRGDILKAKTEYKNTIESKFFSGNIKQAWEGLNILMGKSCNKSNSSVACSQSLVDEMNTFFCRFDTVDDKDECDDICKNLPISSPIFITEDAVAKSLTKLKPNKATGPDGLKARLLKDCASQLKGVFTRLFNFLLVAGVPTSWKFSFIRPIPKKPGASKPEDFRPIAITSILCKTMERVLVDLLTSQVTSVIDPLQFAYRSNRGTDDAVLVLLDFISKQLALPKGYARVLFIDFSAAFNSMKLHILLQRLANINIDNSLILWIRDFLSCRTQMVSVNGLLSGVHTISTGCPQGSVLSPMLFSLFTNDFNINNSTFKLIKYADDMALVGLLQKTNPLDEASYLTQVKALEAWCKDSELEINVAKTNELLFCKKQDIITEPVLLNGQVAETVETFKYLGTVLDNHLSFTDNTEFIFKKCSQRLSLLRRLNSLGVSAQIIELVYITHIESVLTFHLSAWFDHLNCKLKKKLNRIVSMASKIVGKPQKPLSQIYIDRTRKKARKITVDSTHPLSSEFELLKSGRRLRVPLAKSTYKKSFIPNAISILNQTK